MTLLSGFPGGIVRWHSWTGGEVAILTASNFQTIKAFILQRGDRQTYCNMYNRNPHYDFGSFDAFLNPDVGQRNINCDPALSDFDELVVRMRDAGGMWSYLTIQLGPHG